MKSSARTGSRFPRATKTRPRKRKPPREKDTKEMLALFKRIFGSRRGFEKHVVAHLHHIETQLEAIMATQAEFTAILGRIDVATDNIAEDLRRLAEQIGVGMTPAQEDEVKAALEAAAVKLEAVASTNPETVPTP